VIETTRLILREWCDADRAVFHELCNSPAVTAYLGGPASPLEIDAAIARMRSSQEADGFCFWAVERRDDNAFLGYCGLKRVIGRGTAIDGEVEIGWRLREDAWGQGYAREAALATLRWAWRRTPALRVIAMTVPSNRSSWGLMERIGMVRLPELDFGHPSFPDNHPLHRHIVYGASRPA
jgi:RimJ/RimL family protein N-acetyltransferase